MGPAVPTIVAAVAYGPPEPGAPQRLHAQLSGLLQRGYEATTFSQAVLDPPAPRTLAVTFDGGQTRIEYVAGAIAG